MRGKIELNSQIKLGMVKKEGDLAGQTNCSHAKESTRLNKFWS